LTFFSLVKFGKNFYKNLSRCSFVVFEPLWRFQFSQEFDPQN
jgi:hypothetical protein